MTPEEMLEYFMEPLIGCSPRILKDETVRLKQANAEASWAIGEVIDRMANELIKAMFDKQNST